jgi:iron complex outermembrane receptor protein
VFALEQWSEGPWSLGAGLRAERVRVSSLGDDAGAPEPRFGGASSRSFAPRSAALSAGYKLDAQWSLSANLSSTQRAPVYYELYANGLHLATGSFEVGDADLGMERARGLDLGLQWTQGHSALRAQVFSTRFARFLALDATGNAIELPDEDGSTRRVPEYKFRAIRARMQGFELEARHRLPEAWTGRDWQIDLSGQLDSVRGSNSDTGEPLPRLAPLRAGIALEARRGPWGARLELRHAHAQNRVNPQDEVTAAYSMLKASLTRQFRIGNSDATWYLKLDNLNNALAYNASSMLQMRGLAPLPGRSVMTGVQLRF